MAGTCRIGGKIVTPENSEMIIVTKADCEQSNGEWTPSGGTCFVRDVLTRTLGETVLDLGATYGTACAFRDQILKPCAVGSRYLDKYYEHINDTVDAVRDDYRLIAEFIETWLHLVPMVEMMLAADGDTHYTVTDDQLASLRFDKNLHANITGLFRRFIETSQNDRFCETLEMTIEELDRYIDKTIPEILEELRRKDES